MEEFCYEKTIFIFGSSYDSGSAGGLRTGRETGAG